MKKLLALLIISALMLSSCSLIDKIVNTDPPSDPTEDTTPGDTELTEMTGPEDTTDTDPTDTSEPEPDITEPAVEYTNVFFAADNYTVVDMGDGTYAFVSDNNNNGDYNRRFVDAFIIEDRIFLISEGNGMRALHTVYGFGKLQSRINANSFTKCGNHIWANGILYDVDLVEISSLHAPWSVDGLYTSVSEPEYDEENGIIRIMAERDGMEFEHKVYIDLYTATVLPEGAVLIEEYDTGIEKSAIYKADDGYYFTYNHLTVKMPIEGKFDDVSLLTSKKVQFIKMVDGDMESLEVEYRSRNTSTGKYYVVFSTVTYNLTDTFESFGSYGREYNGAKIYVIEPKTYVIKDGQIIHSFEQYFSSGGEQLGELYVIGNKNMHDPYVVLKPDLTLFSERLFYDFTALSDGNCLATYDDTRESVVLDINGEVVYEFPEDVSVWEIGSATKRNEDGTITHIGDWVLAKLADGTLRLLTPYGETLCNFGVIDKDWVFHWMLSGGYYEKEGYPSGVYFIFEDPNDTDNHYGYRSWEYYYSFETGEYGIIDNGYSSFAYAKPVLYLYPTEKTDVTVTFEHPERLIVDYPKYDNGWRVTAMPDGTLTDKNGREYYALYWEESSTTSYYDFVDGFCVKGEDSAVFLEEKLSELGFTDKEANEFIIYWLPILEANEYNLIRFELTDEREASSALHISPAPDSLLRVAMHIKALDTPVQIREQTLPTFERVGFVAVEWGGCIH